MGGPANRQPHRVEAGRLDPIEILFLQHDAPVALLRRFQRIGEIDAASERGLQLLVERIVEDLFHIGAVESHGADVIDHEAMRAAGPIQHHLKRNDVLQVDRMAEVAVPIAERQHQGRAAAPRDIDRFGVAVVPSVGPGVIDAQQHADGNVLRIVHVHLDALEPAQVPLPLARLDQDAGPRRRGLGRDLQGRLSGILRHRRRGLDRAELDILGAFEIDDQFRFCGAFAEGGGGPGEEKPDRDGLKDRSCLTLADGRDLSCWAVHSWPPVLEWGIVLWSLKTPLRPSRRTKMQPDRKMHFNSSGLLHLRQDAANLFVA